MLASHGRLIGRCVPRQGVAGLALAWTAGSTGAAVLRHGTRRYASLERLDLRKLDKKWRDRWAARAAERAEKAEKAEKAEGYGKTDGQAAGQSKYILAMFPYPSGNLHLGHLRVYTIADVVARYCRLQGDDVLLPMGFDSFGLPAENAAIQRGIQPADWTRANIARMKDQLAVMNGSFDWERELSTCEPDFYAHTQRIFLELHRRGLAYEAEAEVNYDPVDHTVLANEQVDANGRSWRSGAIVEKRRLRQWFLRISALRDDLLAGLDHLARDNVWPERVLAMQRHWLGRSTGALVQFPLLDSQGQDSNPPSIHVFTTRIDTLLGVQYLALAPTHPLVQSLAHSDPELCAFLDTLPGLPPDAKVGYELPGLRAINPLAYHDATPAATKASLPVYVAPYVLGDYGEGAVMGVPAHDVRDHAFWQHHRADEPVRVVISASPDEATTALSLDGNSSTPYVGHGVMTDHGGPFAGRSSRDTASHLLTMLQAAHLAEPTERWRLRDWLVSRQRYWGTPIPIIHCDTCGAVPVPDADLPVRLPDVDRHFAEQRAGNPLASAHDWLHVPCPQCHRPARRDTDTMDTFVDSSWYYMRFVDPHNPDVPFDPVQAAARLPVDIYIGGIEHAILHLLYARFIYKVLMQDQPDRLGSDSIREPFARLITQGMVHGKTYVDAATGRFLAADEVNTSDPAAPKDAATGTPLTVSYEKMSKSKRNGIDPTDFIAAHGADATRAHVLFQAPVADVLSWDDDKVAGITRWLGRLYDLVGATELTASSSSAVTKDLRRRAQTIDKTTDPAALARWDADSAVWRDLQTTIASVTASYERVYSLNTVVSDLMRLTNSLAAAAATLSPAVRFHVLSTLLHLLAPVCPAFAEECWAVLHPGAPSLFATSAKQFPAVDGSLEWLQPRRQMCAVQANGKLRCAVSIPRPPPGLASDALRDWIVDAILQTDEGRTKLTAGDRDIRKATKAIVVRDGKLVNFLF